MLPATELIIKEECDRQKIDPQIIMAIVTVESSGISKVARYEKHVINLYKEAEFAKLQKITLDTERLFQKTSWGPMQILGSTARWLGYSSWIPDLCITDVGIRWGCLYYKRVCARQLYLNDSVAVYNAGSVRRKADGSYVNQEYVDKVLAALAEIQSKEQKQSTLM